MADESTVKGRELPRWVSAQAQQLGLQLDFQAARALVARVGDRQQRLVRELEKIAIELGPGAQPSAEEVDELVASSSERKAYTLADAVVAGNKQAAMRAFMELRGQGESVAGLIYPLIRRMRDAHTAAVALEAGESPAQIKPKLKMPPFAADNLIQDVRRHDVETYRHALELLADLELETRGGAGASLNQETAAVRVIQEIGS